jgi:hypothetical protein
MKLGEFTASRRHLETSLATVRRLGDQWASGHCLGWLSWLAWREGNLAQAAALAQESGEILQAFGHRHGYGASLHLLARIAAQQGDWAEAERRYATAAQLYDEVGNSRRAAELEAEMAESRRE